MTFFAKFLPVLILANMLASTAFSEETFEDFEIRVIRPKYFAKSRRFELGVGSMVVTNQTFIYSLLVDASVTYHINEYIALEALGAFGTSIDKEDKSILDEKFNIKTQIIRTANMMSGALQWTPIYGKYQTESGRLVYFDTFLMAGYGSTGVEYIYDHCDPKDMPDGVSPPSKTVMSYPGISIGGGQRFFFTKQDALKWDIRDNIFSYNTKDGSCQPDEGENKMESQNNILIQIAYTRFL